MAVGTFNRHDQIIELSAGDDFTQDRMAIRDIILTGSASGAFVFTVGNTTMTVNTGTADLTKVIPINRSANYVGLTSGPTGAAAYVLLENRR